MRQGSGGGRLLDDTWDQEVSHPLACLSISLLLGDRAREMILMGGDPEWQWRVRSFLIASSSFASHASLNRYVMFKSVSPAVWAFDLEWVPDAAAGRRVYALPSEMSDAEVIAEMWRQGGATEEEPRPYLKTILCRIVSVAAVTRESSRDRGVKLELRSLPRDHSTPMPEAALIHDFLSSLGRTKPQLVGYNSANADLPILIQRGIVNGVMAEAFCARPDKPWEGTDYFVKYGDAHIDLKEIISGWGKGTPSLHEFATTSRVPGKMGTSGDDVVGLWSEGKMREIVQYNEFDALTTYLVWLRTAHFAGFFDDDGYRIEQDRLRALINDRIASGGTHLEAYLRKWEALQR